jgi:hypothetical protein
MPSPDPFTIDVVKALARLPYVGDPGTDLRDQVIVLRAGPGKGTGRVKLSDLLPGVSIEDGVVKIALGTASAVLELAQGSAPAAPSSGVRLYADTSGGKTRLMARFPTGAAQQVAIEP